MVSEQGRSKETLATSIRHMFIARLVVSLLNFFVTARLARVLGTAEYGTNAFAFSLISSLSVFVGLGYDPLLTREISKDPTITRPLVAHAVTLRSCLAVGGFGALALVLWAVGGSSKVNVTILIYGLNFLSVAISVSSVYTGLHQMRPVAGREIAASLLAAVSVFIFVRSSGDLIPAAIVTVGVQLVTNLFILSGYITEYGIPFTRRFASSDRVMLKAAAIYFGSLLMISVTYNAHIVILGLYSSAEETGLFNACWKLFVFAIMVPTLISSLFVPRISAAEGVLARRRQISFLCMKLIVGFAVPVTAFGCVLSPLVLSVAFGQKFVVANPVFRILLLNALVVSVNIGLATPALSLGRQKDYMWIMGSGAVIGLFINMVVIPPFGAIGASCGTLIDEIIILLGLFTISRSEVSTRQVASTAMVCLIAAAPGLLLAAALASWGERRHMSDLAVLIECVFLSGCSYVVALQLLRADLRGIVRHLKAVI